ncbi:MAG: TIGR02206 family membrane protein [Halochromatium sp.]|uniref:YwaF family protein n=1 Tax=Halochromatium sp. TaxID=2049430 RepID=UPI00397D354E
MSNGFFLFSGSHLAAIGLILAASVLLPIAVRSLTPQLARPIGALLALVLVSQELVQLLLLLQRYGPTAQMLPLHLCSLAVWVTAWVLITASPRVFEVVYFWALGGTTQALVTPDLGPGFPSAEFVLFFLGHGLVLVGVTYALIVYRLRPVPASLIRVPAITLGVAALAFGVNLALGTNFMYLMEKPAGTSLLDWFGPWPWYWLALLAIGALIFILLYAPFFIADRLSGRRQRRRD